MTLLALRKEKGISGGGRNVSLSGAPRSLSRVYDRGLARATEDKSVADYIARGRSWRRRGTWRARQ